MEHSWDEWLLLFLTLPLQVLVLPLTLPFAVCLCIGERQERRERERSRKIYVADRARLLPAFEASVLDQLARFEGRLGLQREENEEKEHAKSLVDDVKQLVERMLRFEKRERVGASAQRERDDNFKDIHAAVQRRIEYSAARVRDAEFLRMFSAIYAILKGYRRARGSNEFFANHTTHASP